MKDMESSPTLVQKSDQKAYSREEQQGRTGTKTRDLHVRVTPQQFEQLEAVVKRTGLNKSVLVAIALNDLFSKPREDLVRAQVAWVDQQAGRDLTKE